MRIECKKLRYAAHFLGSLYPGRDADGFADELGTLQDILGRIQDVADTPVFLGRLPHAGDPAFARPIGVVAGWQAAAEHAARAALPHHWDHFLARPRFWSD
jgi:CHAD domain-containing protein